MSTEHYKTYLGYDLLKTAIHGKLGVEGSPLFRIAEAFGMSYGHNGRPEISRVMKSSGCRGGFSLIEHALAAIRSAAALRVQVLRGEILSRALGIAMRRDA